MIEKVEVGLGDRSYSIWVGEGVLPQLGAALRDVDFPSKVAIVTNPTVRGIYGEVVFESLSQKGFQVSFVEIPDGEEYKTSQSLELIYDALIEGGYDRFSGLIALGGGVVGDICGYAAATFLRGVPFAQVPTTLLSQVDSSVGGKTAINHRLGKNLIGAFYQPKHVHIDVLTLKSLPAREFSAGMAEVIKYGIIRDREFFNWLVEKSEPLREQAPEALIHAVKRSCQIKANVVEVDEKESSLRAILNYGHTFGHAVETLCGYGHYRHGEAVAIGMVVAASVSKDLGLCSDDDVTAVRDLLVSFNLPVLPPTFPVDEYLSAMGRDKKVKEGVIRLILNEGIGNCKIEEISDPEKIFSRIIEQLTP